LSVAFVDRADNPTAYVEPRPIVPAIRKCPILLIGQAPGLTEYEKQKPFQGPAGQRIRDVFAEVGVPRDKFDEIVYSTAIVKCFPGSKQPKDGRSREDNLPRPLMVQNCLPFLLKQKAFVQPNVVVTLGRFPLQHYLKIRGNGAVCRLENFVGKTEMWDGAQVVFFPHTSGTSRWHNSPQNRDLFLRAKQLLRDALLEEGIVKSICAQRCN